MDLAAERHFGGRTVWFCEQDKHCVKVLGRHWPGVPVYGDVRTLVADGAEPIDCLLGGPPCQDVSAAGRQAGLVDGERSSLFFDFVAVADALKPRLVIVENVPALLSKWRGVVEDAFAAAGYGCTWARVAAQHVGAPHKRLRVFILAERGGPHRGVCDAGALPAVWVGAWPTPTVPKGGAMTRSGERSDERLLNGAVQPQAWPTPAAKDTGRTVGAYDDYAADNKAAGLGMFQSLRISVERGAQPAPADADDDEAQQAVVQATTARLNPDWVEVLQGLPPGWSETGGESLLWAAQITCGDPPWPAPMVRGQWGDSPQHAWEPPRTVSVRVAARSARLRALGNCNPPQQYLLAFELLERGPAQVSLFELMAGGA